MPISAQPVKTGPVMITLIPVVQKSAAQICVSLKKSLLESGNWSMYINKKISKLFFENFIIYRYFHEFSLSTNFVLCSFGRKIMPSKYPVKSLRGKICHLFVNELFFTYLSFKNQIEHLESLKFENNYWNSIRSSNIKGDIANTRSDAMEIM